MGVSLAQEMPAGPAFAYLLDDHLGEALVEAPSPRAHPPALSFKFGGAATDWTAHAAEIEAKEDHLVFSTQGPGEIVSPSGLNLSGPDVDAVVIRMKVTGTTVMSLGWRPKGEAEAELHRVVRAHVARPGEMATYKIQLGGVRAWRYRQIDQIKLAVGEPATIELASMEFLPRKSVFSEKSVGLHGFSIDNKMRPCLFAHCPAALRYKLTVPPKGQFTAGLGIVDDVPATFGLTVTENGETKTIFEKTVSNNTQWHDVRADLSEYEGHEVEVGLRVQSEQPDQVALWSSPAVYADASLTRRTGVRPGERPPNVLVYVVDCLRADHLDLYGYGRETAPNLKAFAQTAARFKRCYSQDTWTKPSMSTFLTGVDSYVHGIKAFGDVIPDSLVLLPELLRQCGYVTGAITENPHTPPDTNDRRAFSFLETPHLRVEVGEPKLTWNELPAVTHAAAAQFMENNKDRPFFLYVHTMELHDIIVDPPAKYPVYDPPASYRTLFSEEPTAMDLFDGAIRYADANFQRTLDTLTALGLDKNTVVIFTADHGEGFGEHENKYGHYGKPYNELIHIPLLVRLPEMTDARVSTQNVGIFDVAPTILELAGLTPQAQFQGRSLLPLIMDGNFGDRPVFSSWLGCSSIIQGDWKLMDDSGKKMLSNLVNDPGEKINGISNENAVASKLEQLLTEHIREQSGRGNEAQSQSNQTVMAIDPAAQEALESLGYLEAAPAP